jgi:hypothetical protein
VAGVVRATEAIAAFSNPLAIDSAAIVECDACAGALNAEDRLWRTNLELGYRWVVPSNVEHHSLRAWRGELTVPNQIVGGVDEVNVQAIIGRMILSIRRNGHFVRGRAAAKDQTRSLMIAGRVRVWRVWMGRIWMGRVRMVRVRGRKGREGG